VELTVTEFLFGADRASLFDDFHIAILDFPSGRLPFAVFPLEKVKTAETTACS